MIVEDEAGWRRFSALEGRCRREDPGAAAGPARAVPENFRTGLDAVLDGADGNTYLFKGRSCYDVALGREFATAEDWGRPRNTIADGEGVDAAFVGRDGKTYVFSGDQFVTYPGSATPTPRSRGTRGWSPSTGAASPRSRLAYVRDGVTYLFEPPDAGGNRRYVVYSGIRLHPAGPGLPADRGPRLLGRPAGVPRRGAAPVAVLFDRDNTLYLTASQYVAAQRRVRRLVLPSSAGAAVARPARWAPRPTRCARAFTGADGATYFFSRDEFTRFADGAFSAPRADPAALGAGPQHHHLRRAGRPPSTPRSSGGGRPPTCSPATSTSVTPGPSYRYVDAGYPKSVVADLR